MRQACQAEQLACGSSVETHGEPTPYFHMQAVLPDMPVAFQLQLPSATTMLSFFDVRPFCHNSSCFGAEPIAMCLFVTLTEYAQSAVPIALAMQVVYNCYLMISCSSQ